MHPILQVVPVHISPGDPQRRQREIAGQLLPRSETLLAKATAIQPEPVPTSSARRGPGCLPSQSRACSTSNSVSGRGMSAAGRDDKIQAVELPMPEHVRQRLTVFKTCQGAFQLFCCSGVQNHLGVSQDPGARSAQHMRQQHLCIQGCGLAHPLQSPPNPAQYLRKEFKIINQQSKISNPKSQPLPPTARFHRAGIAHR